MRSFLIALALLFAPAIAAASCPSLPFTLTNGQTADANQVMANLNSVNTCAGNAVQAGPNFNITSLNGLTTPLSIPQGGTGATTGSGAISNLGGLQASLNLTDVANELTALSNLGGLAKVNNLSDVASAATSRSNLGVAYGTTAGTVAQGNDSRFNGPTQNSQSAAYGLLITDAGEQIYHPAADTTPRTWTIPANASVAYAIGTKIELVNDCSAGAITLAITSDVLEWFPSGTTGSRTIAACGQATITKLTATEWSLVGVGLS